MVYMLRSGLILYFATAKIGKKEQPEYDCSCFLYYLQPGCIPVFIL